MQWNRTISMAGVLLAADLLLGGLGRAQDTAIDPHSSIFAIDLPG